MNTLDDTLRKLALHTLVEAGRDERAAELFFDLQYIHKFGILPKIPMGLKLPPLPIDPVQRIQQIDTLLFGLVNIALGDPDPEPNIYGVLQNKKIRLAAARALHKRLSDALQRLSKEIS